MSNLRPLAIAVACTTALTAAAAGTANDGNGRYTMIPVEGGLMRLDTGTGAVSLCTRNSGTTWSCEPVNDKSTASGDAARLEAENKELKERIKALEQAQPQGNASDGSAAPGGVTKLPTEKEVDEALDYAERMYKKFRDRIHKLEQAPDAPAPKSSDGGPGAF